MTNDKGILIRNIYYMLAYAFQDLRQNNYAEIAGEDFEEILCLVKTFISEEREKSGNETPYAFLLWCRCNRCADYPMERSVF